MPRKPPTPRLTKETPDALPVLAVLIATCNRPGLLAQRSLTAVQRQSRSPDFLVVVDDSDGPHRADNRNIVNDLRLGSARIVYLTNSRTRGASGAWNTGLDWLRRHAGDPKRLLVAVLDDDDEWEPDHLKACMDAVRVQGLDMVAAPVVRITSDASPRIQTPPPTLDASLFLVGNPHIQGSNLFVRLSALLQAGTFDESLQSCTDRDLCIRLADLGWVRYAALDVPTVRHFADTSRPRLSSPTADPKRSGLDRFWAKWHGRMTDEQRTACLERAHRLFGWSPPIAAAATASDGPLVPYRDPTAQEILHADDLVLVVGVIGDDDHADQLSRMFDDLIDLQGFDQICSLDVVVLHNGGESGALARVVADYRSRGLTLFVASPEQQADDAARGAFGEGFTRPPGRAPIGPARTMLQSYVTRVANQRPGAIAWILDDDSRLDNVSDGIPIPPFRNLLASLKRMHSLGIDVVLGTVTGDPPIPPGSTVRTQLVDLYHSLSWLVRFKADDVLPDRRAENRNARASARDFYYDLSRRDTHHLEWPFWLTPTESGESVGHALRRMIDALPRILAGQGVFRPLVLDTPCETIASMRPSVQRGTNTFVFDCRAFTDFPNAAPRFAGDVLRRSDMIWALLNRYAGGRRIVGARLPIRHDRANEPPVGLDLQRLIPDIRGYALYSALEDVLVRRRERRLRDGLGAEVPDDLQFREGDLDLGVSRFRKYLVERTAALLMSSWRIQGLCDSITSLKRVAIASGLFGQADEQQRYAQALSDFLAQTRGCFAVDALEQVVERVLDVPADEIRSFFRGLSALVDRHRKAIALHPHEDRWFHAERCAAASALARSVAGTDELCLLGAGGEGVVFSADTAVVKVIDYSKRSIANGATQGLRRLAATTNPLTGLYQISMPAVPGHRLVIRYPFDRGDAYRGGHAADLIQILRDCRAAGIVTSNFHPKNLIVTRDGVKLIDYGSDIRLFSDEGFRSMVQRAWLTLRCHDRDDLALLMRHALTDTHLPELEGWEALLAAVDPVSKRESVDDAVIDIVREWQPRRVLDFGCGHGRIAAALAAQGSEVVAFDPDPALAERWARQPEIGHSGVRWLSRDCDAVLKDVGGTFDAVVCSLVLCVLEHDQEYRSAIRALVDAMTPSGRFLILVCNPEATLTSDSTLQRRLVPPPAERAESFVWTKVLPSGNHRRDVHRETANLVADLAAAGLTAEYTTTTGGLSLPSLLPSDDHLLIVGSKHSRAVPLHNRRSPAARGNSRGPKTVPVFCHHRVLPRELDDAISRFQRIRGTVVDLEVFTRQLDDLRRSFEPVTLSRYFDWLDGTGELPRNACLLTFDDGYRDFADHALPALSARDIPSVLFATMSAARHDALLPVDLLYSALGKACDEGRLSADDQSEWITGKRKREYVRAAPSEQVGLLTSAGLEPGRARPSDLYLSEQELARLSAKGVTLGGHGWRHELLADKSLSELRTEFRRVRHWLERLNGNGNEERLAFAYPNGSQGPTTVAAAIEAGFSAAFTVESCILGERDHRWRLRRSCVPNQVDAIAQFTAGKELRL